MEPDIQISKGKLTKIATALNALLADETILYLKTRKAHWNIEGTNFMELHAFFQKQYEELEGMIDDTAERIRMLGHFALGSMKDFAAVAHLEEEKHGFRDQRQIISELLRDHGTIIGVIRNALIPVAEDGKDFGTADFITGLLQMHEKMAWMLRAYIS